MFYTYIFVAVHTLQYSFSSEVTELTRNRIVGGEVITNRTEFAYQVNTVFVF